MSEQTVKIEIEVPVEVKRFVEALQEFTGLDMNRYLVRCITQSMMDSINPNCDGLKVIDLEAYKTIKEKYGLDGLCEKLFDP